MSYSSTLPPGTVRVSRLWERYRIYRTRPHSLKDRIIRRERVLFEDLWALKDVTFDLEPGEAFAVLGANGSGKTTLLKCLAAILRPDRGDVAVGGSVACLLELGAGFKEDLSGRENIYLNASILGLPRRRIDAILDPIIDFSGVREFIETPIRNYSSGMRARLGFAVAVHVDPDVLLIDEILAVGDAGFRARCNDAIHDFKRRGKTIVLVTHDLDTAIRLCDRALLLDRGEMLFHGPSRPAVETYRRLVADGAVGLQSIPRQDHARMDRGWGTGEAEITRVELLNELGRAVTAVGPGACARLRIAVQFHEDTREPNFACILRGDDGLELYSASTVGRGISTGTFRAGTLATVEFRQRYHLAPGRYTYTCGVGHSDGSRWYQRRDECLEFRVDGDAKDGGRVHLDAEIQISRPQ